MNASSDRVIDPSAVRAVFLGEVVLDVTASKEDPLAMRGHPGGGPLNAAVAVARLGLRSSAITGMSSDAYGRAIANHLLASGVDLSLVNVTDDPTAVAFAVEGPHGTVYRFLFDGTADKTFDPRPRPTLPADTRFVQLNSLTSFDEPSRSTNLDLLRAARAAGAIVVFDPTVRPLLQPELPRWFTMLESVLPHVDIVKASDQDLDFLFPGRDSLDAARVWLAADGRPGPHAVIVTFGPDGAVLLRANHEPVRVDAVQTEVIDTIGAGDTFSAATMCSLVEHGVAARSDLDSVSDGDWREILAFAARAAAITCSRHGADPPTRAELH
jgi:fructokinase